MIKKEKGRKGSCPLCAPVSEEQEPVKNLTASAFIKRHRLKSSSAVQAAAKKLLEYDLLTRNEGSYSIADPLMALWLKSKRF